MQTALKLQIYGYCRHTAAELTKLFEDSGASALRQLDGEYVIVVHSSEPAGAARSSETWIVSSANGVVNYFYAVIGSKFYHGDTILPILTAANLTWNWNWPALADVLFLDHVVDRDTLHPQIHRVPPAGVLHWNGGTLHVDSVLWQERFPRRGPSDSTQTVQALNQESAKWLTDNTIVSMSGGFDSRVLLSSVLKLGVKPRAFLTQGSPESTDVLISQAIARRFDIPIEVVGLEAEDYLRFGAHISRLTNGTKTAQNWHTYIYPAKATIDLSGPFIVGSNGEFARSYLFDYGFITSLANVSAPSLAARKFWSLKLKPYFYPEELSTCAPEFAAEFSAEGRERRIERYCTLSAPHLSEGLDRFYLEQRVRHFIANGLKLYSQHTNWRTPFLGTEWTQMAWNLPRHWKLGNNWHRHAVAKNAPALLEFPEPSFGDVMPRRAPAFYWAPFRKKRPVIGYAKYREWFATGILSDYIQENAEALSPLIPKPTLNKIVTQHRLDGSRTRVLSFLLALIFWCENLQSLPAQRETSGPSTR